MYPLVSQSTFSAASGGAIIVDTFRYIVRNVFYPKFRIPTGVFVLERFGISLLLFLTSDEWNASNNLLLLSLRHLQFFS